MFYYNCIFQSILAASIFVEINKNMLKKLLDLEHHLKEVFAQTVLAEEVFRFVEELNNSVVSHSFADLPELVVFLKVFQEIGQLIDKLIGIEKKFDRTESVEANTRYGNTRFRAFVEEARMVVETECSALVSAHCRPGTPSEELAEYFVDALGNVQRIDFGTGHELSFFFFLLALRKADAFAGATGEKLACGIHRLFQRYLVLCRLLQKDFRLEPAGSKGVWGVDDFHFLPVLFGSAQLVDRPEAAIDSFAKIDPVFFADRFYFFQLLLVIKQTKSGQLWENSPLIFSFQQKPSWRDVNAELLQRFRKDVLFSWPVAQHFKFGILLPLE